MRIEIVAVGRLGKCAEAQLATDYARRASASGRALAWMVYLPLVGLGAFAAFILATLPARWRARRFGEIAMALVGFTAGIAAFPHYFLFRPDLSHVANFMPGYVVMAGVFAVQAWRALCWSAAPWRTAWATRCSAR